MHDPKSELKPYDMETSMQLAVDVMFTKMQATQGFKLFGERAVATMVNELKQLKHGPMPGKKVVTAVNPDTLSFEEKEGHSTQ